MRQPDFHLISVLTVAALVAGCGRQEIHESLIFEQPLTRLDVNVSSDLTVEPSQNDTTTVEVNVGCTGWGDPDYSVTTADDALKIAFDCSHQNDGRIVVRVSRSVVDSALSVDSGDMRVSALAGRVALNVDSGNISGTVACDVCSASSDSGDITLTFSAPPRSLSLDADSGDIKARVPAGAYNLSTDVDSGSRSISSITLDPTSPNEIKAKVDSGDISITGY